MPEHTGSPDERDTTASVRCPSCGTQAEVSVAWRTVQDTPHADVRDYRCPHGCEVDAETIRNLVGAQ